MAIQFDISRDFLDGIMLQHPAQGERTKPEIKANGGIQFLPSSPDGTMHTAVVSFALGMEGSDHPFAKAGWRFLFTTSESFKPQESNDEPFLRTLLVAGAGKIITVLNNLCLHANMPQIPISSEHLVRNTQLSKAPAEGEA